MEETLGRLIGNVGFPIAAFLMMYRLVAVTLAENTHALQELRAAVEELRATIAKRSGKRATEPPG